MFDFYERSIFSYPVLSQTSNWNLPWKSVIVPSAQISPLEILPLKMLTKPYRPTNIPINSPWITPPADTPPQKGLRNQIGPGYHHVFLQYLKFHCPLPGLIFTFNLDITLHLLRLLWVMLQKRQKCVAYVVYSNAIFIDICHHFLQIITFRST